MLSAALASMGLMIMAPGDKKLFVLVQLFLTMRGIFKYIGKTTGLFLPIREGRGNEPRILTVESVTAYFSIVYLAYKFIYNFK